MVRAGAWISSTRRDPGGPQGGSDNNSRRLYRRKGNLKSSDEYLMTYLFN